MVERVFSIINVTKTKLRNRMKTDMLSTLSQIKVHLNYKTKCCNDFECTKYMFERFNNSIYSTPGNINSEENNDVLIEIVNSYDNIPHLNLAE